jgi:signal transduction histidine kinase
MDKTTHEELIHIELLNRSLKLAPFATIATIINAAILIVVLWTNTPHSTLILWFVGTWCVLLLRLCFLFRYRPGSVRPEQVARVSRLFVIGVFLSGSIWGSAGFFLFPENSPTHQTLIVFVLCGMVAGASEAFSSIMTAFIAFAFPALIPLLIRLLIIGGPVYYAMSAMTLLYLVLTTFISKRINATTRELVELNNHFAQMVQERTKSAIKMQEEITSRKRAEDSLRASEAQLRLLSSRLISTQEDERRKIACDLHDTIGQTLAAMKYWVEALIHSKDTDDPEEATRKLRMFVPILQNSIEETRAIYMGLRPSMLDSIGVVATLRWLRQEFCSLHPKQHVELTLDIAEEEIPEPLKIVIFRIVQESLNNIAKHSSAEWVDLLLERNGDSIKLSIKDDGVGINVESLSSRANNWNSLGLRSMRERAEFSGGTFSFESAPGQGVSISAIWPVEKEMPHENAPRIL